MKENNKKLASATSTSKEMNVANQPLALGQDTPVYLQSLLKQFEKFVQKEVPDYKDFQEKYLPELITWLTVMYNLLQFSPLCDYVTRFYDDTGKSFSPYCKAAKQFQEHVNAIFKKLEVRHGFLKEGEPLIASQEIFFPFGVLTDIFDTLLYSGKDGLEALCRLPLFLGIEFDIKSLPQDLQYLLEEVTTIVDCNEGIQIVRTPRYLSPRVLKDGIGALKHTDKKAFHRSMQNILARFMVLWKKDQGYYFIAPARKDTSRLTYSSAIWAPSNSGLMGFHYKDNKLLTYERGIMLSINIVNNDVAVSYIKRNRGMSLGMFGRKEAFIQAFMEAYFPEITQKERETNSVYRKFIPLPQASYDEWRSIGLEDFFEYHADEDLMYRAFFSKLGFDTTMVENSFSIDQDETIKQQVIAKTIAYDLKQQSTTQKTTIRKETQQEVYERKKNQEERNLQKLKSYKEGPINAYLDLVKLVNICRKLNPKQESTITQKGSHCIAHTSSGITTVVIPHGKQKGNEITKKIQNQVKRNLGID